MAFLELHFTLVDIARNLPTLLNDNPHNNLIKRNYVDLLQGNSYAALFAIENYLLCTLSL